jgi:hypothetical protein
MSNSLSFKIQPSWEELDFIRDELEKFLSVQSFNKDEINSMIMTCSELAENAIKYGHHENDADKVEIYIDVYPKEVIIEVKNKIHNVDNDELRTLDENIQWIRGFQNKYEAYIEKLKHVQAKGLKSGLGLARIAYEGQCILDFYVNENDILAISAEYKMPNPN